MNRTQCTQCGLAQDEWMENEGEGIKKYGRIYCSEDCAQGAKAEIEEYGVFNRRSRK